MTSWALCFRREQATALAKLYDVADVRVGEADSSVWARGAGSDEDVERILSRVPASRVFEIIQHDRLRPRGRLLPVGRLPDVRWVSLREWLAIRMPAAHIPGRLTRSAELTLVSAPSERRSDAEEELLLCRVAVFRDFLLHAPAHRLRPLRFVVNDHTSEVLVRGHPLPSVPGERFVVAGGIATPPRHAWSPPVPVSVVRAWLGLRDDVIALWRADGSISEIGEEKFASASRRAGRAL